MDVVGTVKPRGGKAEVGAKESVTSEMDEHEHNSAHAGTKDSDDNANESSCLLSMPCADDMVARDPESLRVDGDGSFNHGWRAACREVAEAAYVILVRLKMLADCARGRARRKGGSLVVLREWMIHLVSAHA